MRVAIVASDTTGTRLDAMPTIFDYVPGDGDVVCFSLRYMLGVCPAAVQDKPYE